MLPIGLFLIFLTGVGPLLAWRVTSLRSIRRNFVLPCIAIIVTAIILMLAGVRPWNEPTARPARIYSLVCFSLCAGVITAISAEFLRGAGVIRTQSGRNLLSSAILLTRRNTRRYGGYIIHFGIVVIFIGVAGSAFNQSQRTRNGLRRLPPDRLLQARLPELLAGLQPQLRHRLRSPRRLPQRQEDHAARPREAASTTPASSRRPWSPSTPTLADDIYIVFEGRNPETDKPIIKVFLNPLVNWIWIGVGIVIFGTGIALVPPLKPATRRAEETAAQKLSFRSEAEESAFAPARRSETPHA